jgi:hypothetical protein
MDSILCWGRSQSSDICESEFSYTQAIVRIGVSFCSVINFFASDAKTRIHLYFETYCHYNRSSPVINVRIWHNFNFFYICCLIRERNYGVLRPCKARFCSNRNGMMYYL